ncbi:hypothetical protein NMP99_01250 [Glutamicibacter mishrai]|uniref:hypothetical protein n=1 Tax=Glutamicibacter mishrai TaxID=1775880 RepID=UPI0020CDC04B|nr:hypothetical protein [Glutamicibacter mishrai]UTT39966.1 hypothetical protein NMP99_01250 [Glutamicibacter mishrai]
MTSDKQRMPANKLRVNSDEVYKHGKVSMRIILVGGVVASILAVIGFIFIPLGTVVEGAGRHGNGVGTYALLVMPALSFVLWKQMKKGSEANRLKSDDVLTSRSVNAFGRIASVVFSAGFVVGEIVFMHGLAVAEGIL